MASISSEEELQNAITQRKLKRMQSNRESARRSRQRKQKLLDNLAAQVVELREVNQHCHTKLSITTQQCINIEAENSVLKAQVVELRSRMESLNQLVLCMHANIEISGGLLSPCIDMGGMIHQSVLMDCSDVLQY